MAQATAQATTSDSDPGTIYFGGRPAQEPPKFWMAPWHGTLELRATATNAETSNAGGDTSTQEQLFQEQLTLYTHGFVVHPNIMDYRFSVTGGLTQDHFSDDQGSDSSNGTVYGWDVGAIFFRNQPARLTVYSRRTEAMMDVPFGETLRTTNTQTGAILDYKTRDSFSQLEAYHEEDSQTSLGQGETDFSQKRDVFRGTGDAHPTENQTLTWAFELQSATYDSGLAETDETSASGAIGHVVTFGDDKLSSLSSGLSYTTTTNNLDREDLRWTEHLRLYHSPTLETNYDYSYQLLSYGGAATEHHSAYVDARHKLYKSLITLARVHYDDVNTGGSSTQTYGADLDFDYKKIVPNGMLLADAHLGWQRQSIGDSGTIFVFDQPIAFAGITPVTVAQTNTIPDTILIRNATTGQTYVEGVDYTITQTPLGPEINRVLGGNILPGQPLLLSYGYDPLDANEIDTTTYGTGVRYQFTKGPLAGLTPYARFFGQDQTVSGGLAEPNNVRDYTIGSYYQISDLTLRAEREWYDSSLFPYDAWRYEARINHRFSYDTTMSLSGLFSDIQYHEPEQHTKNYSVNASVTQRLTTRLNLTAYAAYALVESDIGGETEGVEEGLEGSWYHRETKIWMRLRNSTLNSDTAEQNFQFFQVGLTRTF